MNIVTVKKLPGQQDYLLKEDERTVLKLRYKEEMHTARVETEKEKRVLIIEHEGLLRTKLVLKNEYGVPIASLNYDNFSDSHGFVDIENTRFRFFFQNKSVPQLHIYKGSRRNFIYSCQLPLVAVETKVAKSQSASFVIAVSGYLFWIGVGQAQFAVNESIIF